MPNLILSAFADEYSDSIEEQARALRDFGIFNLELRHACGKNVSEMQAEDLAIIKEQLDKENIKVSSIGSPLGKIKLSDDFNSHLEVAKRVFETANFFGAKFVRMFSFYIPLDNNDYTDQVFERLNSLCNLASEHGVTLCHENEANIYGESPKKCLKIAKEFNGKIKCVFDMGNFVLDGYDPISAYKTLFPYIAYFHVKDALKAGAIVPPGLGEAKIKEILDDYKINGKADAFITLEPHLQTFSGLNALVGKSFDNPYKYPDQKQAFTDAVIKLKQIL